MARRNFKIVICAGCSRRMFLPRNSRRIYCDDCLKNLSYEWGRMGGRKSKNLIKERENQVIESS